VIGAPAPPGKLSHAMKKHLWIVLAAIAATAFAPLRAASAAQDAGALVEEIKKNRDDADPAKLQELAALRTRAAVEGLIECYDMFNSVYMKLLTLRALPAFDGAAEAEQPALQKLADVATGAPEPELRQAAVNALGDCKTLGKHYLQLIVDSPAADDVRVRAFELHVASATPEDAPWYEKQFRTVESESPAERKAAKKSAKDAAAAPVRRVAVIPRLRELALQQIAGKMDAKELAQLATDKEKDATDLKKDGIRRIALSELGRRKDKQAVRVAEDVYKDQTERSENRIVAAKILAAEQGNKVAATFVEDGCKQLTPLDMAYTLADLVAAMKDDATNKKLVRLAGKGKAAQKLFVLRAVRGIPDPKLDAEITAMLEDASQDEEAKVRTNVRIAVCETLGVRKVKAAVPQLEAIVASATDEELAAAALEAITQIREGDAEWSEKLVGYASSTKVEVRNAALTVLGKRGDAALLKTALNDPAWSTRLVALRGLERLRTKEGVAAIIERMPQEEGRMLHEFADVLWRLTGQPFRIETRAWKGWWEKASGDFQPISEAELAKRESEEEARRLKHVSKTTSFFGIRIKSHRVIFILDVSGSMNEATRAEYVGKEGEPRISVAKRELNRCIDGLDEASLFNIITFSGGVSHWADGVSDSKESSRKEAKDWVDKLGADGGTNLYGALQVAFEDPDVDTIFILSDGEPMGGQIDDPGTIREHVRVWNENRHIVLNTIAVGGRFAILRWLAEDSGGTHVEFP
jgi:hypothetical protein